MLTSHRLVRSVITRAHSCSKPLSTVATLPRIAVCGSGPSAFYSIKYLLDKHPDVHIDIIEKLPTPFGLVRYGVAPDHPDVKSVVTQFAEIAENKRVQYFGNVVLGKDVELSQLLSSYSAVVLGIGATSDRKLGISGEVEVDERADPATGTLSSGGLLSARSFVHWYNGHPEFAWVKAVLQALPHPLRDVVIVGHGNVAIDCARIMTESLSELQHTDIVTDALEVIRGCGIERVHLLGRRGHVQAAFTIKELRELSKLAECRLVIRRDELDAGMTDASRDELAASRPRKRITDLVENICKGTAPGVEGIKKQEIHLRFLVSPTDITSSEGWVSGVKTVRNSLVGGAGGQAAVATAEEELLPAQLLLRSVGYKSEPVPGLEPEFFDDRRAVVCNQRGRVTSTASDATVKTGLYVTGWLKRGPSGIIGTNIADAKETVESVLTDLESGMIAPVPASGGDISPLRELLAPDVNVVDWAGFRRIDAEETRRGQVAGKLREKITDVCELLAVAGRCR